MKRIVIIGAFVVSWAALYVGFAASGFPWPPLVILWLFFGWYIFRPFRRGRG